MTAFPDSSTSFSTAHDDEAGQIGSGDAGPEATRSLQSLPADLFPLPLTPFERLMLDDDHREYPRTFTVTIELTGQLDQHAFEQAALEVIRRNPLLSSLVKKYASSWHWILVPFPRGQIIYGDQVSQETPSFHLQTTPGFQIRGRTDGIDSEVHLTFHHAVCDGQGARRVVLDWLSAYATLTAPDSNPISMDQLDYERLRQRGEFRGPGSTATANPASPTTNTLTQKIRTISEFFTQQPVSLRPGSHIARHTRQNLPHQLTCRFDRHQVDQFRSRLRGSRITLNDLAVAMLLHSIAKWNQAHGESGRNCLYRILIPVDLRENGDQLLPATNRLSFVFITRPKSLCLDLPRLLETVRAEMDYIDEHGSKYNLINALHALQSIPGVIPLAVRAPLCLSTAVLTNLGDPSRGLRHRFPAENGLPVIGNLRFVRAGGAPPLRPRTHLGIGLSISRGELAMQSQFDPRAFSAADAAEFLQIFADNWRAWAATSQF